MTTFRSIACALLLTACASASSRQNPAPPPEPLSATAAEQMAIELVAAAFVGDSSVMQRQPSFALDPRLYPRIQWNPAWAERSDTVATRWQQFVERDSTHMRRLANALRMTVILDLVAHCSNATPYGDCGYGPYAGLGRIGAAEVSGNQAVITISFPQPYFRSNNSGERMQLIGGPSWTLTLEKGQGGEWRVIRSFRITV